MTRKIYTFRSGGLTTAGLEGNGLSLTEGFAKYKLNGRFRTRAEFSPILFETKGVVYSLSGNMYAPEACLLSVGYSKEQQPNVALTCTGTGEIAIEFLEDFAKSLEVIANEPSEKLKASVTMTHLALEEMWNLSALFGKARQKQLFIDALKTNLALDRQKQAIRN